jgi:translation initiation factor IF-3
VVAQTPINQYIRAKEVRLIVPKNDSDTGEEVMLGIFSLEDALAEAEKLDVDLVLINDKADPPVCKAIDYGKYKYLLEKKKKENLKKQVKVDIKEVKMSYKIDQHDFDVRLRAAQKFLGDGDRVNLKYNHF